MRRYLRIVVLFVCTVLVLLPVGQSLQAALNRTPAAQVLGITLAIQQPPTNNYGVELNSVNTLTGKKHGIVLYYLNWATTFNTFLPDQINNQMAPGDRPVVMFAWQPTDGRAALGCTRDYNGLIPFDDIIRGLCDTYIQNYANAVKARAERFLIKLAHEMNGGGQPWSPVNTGVNPSLYVAMWRHVHDIFAAQGVTNVEWVWAPIYVSIPALPENDIHLYYPGDDYVDWVAVSGYNYYLQYQGATEWNTFEMMFDAILKDFACRYPKPQLIHETASVEDTTGTYHKTDWIADTYVQAQNYPFLRGLVWYNDRDSVNPNADFRITTSTAHDGSVQALPANGSWTNAYKNAVASPIYTKTLPSLTAATPPMAYCGNGGAVFSAQPAAVMLVRGQSSSHQFVGINYASAVNVSLSLPATISGSVTPNTLPAPWGTATIHLQTSASTPLGVHTVNVQVGPSTVPIRVVVVASIKRSFLPIIVK